MLAGAIQPGMECAVSCPGRSPAPASPKHLSAGTISAPQAGRTAWDVVVVGAGPAGSMAARQLAREGLSVLLVDRQLFPRWKICGACLNAGSTNALREAGLGTMLQDLGAVRLSEMRIAAWSRQACLRLPESFSVSRRALDAALLTAAIEAGVEFLPGASATLGPCCRDAGDLARHSVPSSASGARIVRLSLGAGRVSVAGRVVVAADGLSGGLLSSDGAGRTDWQAPAARVGVGATSPIGPDFYVPGTIFMAIGTSGYLGLVRLENQQLNIAAAFDKNYLRHAGGAGKAAAAVLEQAGLPAIGGVESLAWKGTVPLTRRPAARAIERVFAIGDAAGYVEPFTGEGISWALAGALVVSSFVRSAVRSWDSSLVTLWEKHYRDTIARSQRTCAILASLLRRPLVVRSAVALLEQLPAVAVPVVRRVGRPHHRRPLQEMTK